MIIEVKKLAVIPEKHTFNSKELGFVAFLQILKWLIKIFVTSLKNKESLSMNNHIIFPIEVEAFRVGEDDKVLIVAKGREEALTSMIRELAAGKSQ